MFVYCPRARRRAVFLFLFGLRGQKVSKLRPEIVRKVIKFVSNDVCYLLIIVRFSHQTYLQLKSILLKSNSYIVEL